MGNTCCSKVSNTVETPEKKRKSYQNKAQEESRRSKAAKDPQISGQMDLNDRDGPDT